MMHMIEMACDCGPESWKQTEWERSAHQKTKENGVTDEGNKKINIQGTIDPSKLSFLNIKVKHSSKAKKFISHV
uniref:SUI1 domain-containing protein n=1 Tax=Panagrellus redivivus TaxID=6233 RepID=A0A7E4VIU4_PANRE